jgi:hypothetical protein
MHLFLGTPPTPATPLDSTTHAPRVRPRSHPHEAPLRAVRAPRARGGTLCSARPSLQCRRFPPHRHAPRRLVPRTLPNPGWPRHKSPAGPGRGGVPEFPPPATRGGRPHTHSRARVRCGAYGKQRRMPHVTTPVGCVCAGGVRGDALAPLHPPTINPKRHAGNCDSGHV